MSKFDPLWDWIKENGTESFKLTFSKIENIAGFPMDHSFLTYKKELIPYGYKVRKISMKEQTVTFEKTVEQMKTGNEISPVYELKDTSKVKELFIGWQETLVYSCLQHVMGKIYVTDTEKPESAFAVVGCFGFFAGKPDRELVAKKPDGFVIMVPQNEAWSALIEECYPSAKKVKRFAIKKDTVFDVEKLQKEISKLPAEYELRQIDADLYDQCLENPVTADFVSAFESKEQYLIIGRGMVILKDGKIVSGASSYTRYNEGIEIEVDTIEPERRKHLATIACSALILKCLDEGLYPSWDAQNMHSVRLAEKLGYEFDHAYTAYEVAAEARTH